MVRIPSEYQEVEWIESPNNQYAYINTGIPITEDLRFIIDFQSVTSFSGAYLMGIYSGTSFYLYKGAANMFQTAFGCQWKNTSLQYDTSRHIFEYSFENGHLNVREEGNVILTALDTDFSQNPIIMIAGNSNSGAVKNTSRTFSSKMFQNEELIQNLIPCYHKSSGEIGMYDTVSKQFYTNSGTGTFLKGNDVTYNNINLLESRRRILLNTPRIETVSDTIAGFKTDVATKLKGCKVYFTPIQEGTGDPSPDNVRPIHGWDGVTVTACGKNLFDKSKCTTSRLIDSTGSIVSNSSWFVTDFIPLQGTKVSCHGSRRANTTYHAFYDEIKQLVSVVKQEQINDLTIPSKARYIRCSCANEYANVFQVELNSAPTSYEPYNATTLTIPFPQTIYGGYVDLMKGEVVEEWTKRNLNAFSQTIISGGGFQVGHWLSSGWEKKNGTNNFISDVFKQVISGTVDQTMKGYGNTYPILLYDSSITTVDEFKEKYADNYIVYAIRHPITYSIDPQTLKALRGINNIWSNANGNIEVSFYTH